MPTLRPAAFVVAITCAAVFVFEACIGQHDPRPDWKKFEKERVASSKPVMQLTSTGEIPAADAGQGPSIAEKYVTYCSSCHGATGGGDGPAGAALNPKPRNFHDAAWQASVDDERITNVIKNGGPAAGLSPMMAPWGGVLSDEEVTQMVAHIRSLKQG